MQKRRGAGEGSIYKRKDGRWTAALTTGSDDHGRPRRRCVYGKTRREVAEKLAQLQTDATAGTLGDAGTERVGPFLDRWLEDAARPTIRTSTYQLYEGLIRVHIRPHLGGVGLAKLNPAHLVALQSTMERRQGASPRMRQLVHQVLHRAFGQAVRWGLIPRNPTDAVDRPRAPRPEIQSLEPEQVAELLKAARGDRLEARACSGAISTWLERHSACVSA